VHQRFLEYFCALEIVQRFDRRGLEGGLTLEELKTDVFGKHCKDKSWHEILELIAQMIPGGFVDDLIDHLNRTLASLRNSCSENEKQQIRKVLYNLTILNGKLIGNEF
jgi:predicted NACHT family NTPase